MLNLYKWIQDLNTTKKILCLLAILSLLIITNESIGVYFRYKSQHTQLDQYKKRLENIIVINKCDDLIQQNINKLQGSLSINSNQARLRNQLDVLRKQLSSLLSEYKQTKGDNFENQTIDYIDENLDFFKERYNQLNENTVIAKTKHLSPNYYPEITVLHNIDNSIDQLSMYNLTNAKKEFSQEANAKQIIDVITLLSTLFILLIFFPIGYFVGQMIAEPIERLVRKINEVAKGNLNINSTNITSKDEIGELNTAFNTMTEKLKSLIESETFLKEIMLASISSLNIRKTINTIVNKTGQKFKANRCFILEYDYSKNKFLPIKDFATYISDYNVRDISDANFTEKLLPFSEFIFRENLTVSNIEEVNLPLETKQAYFIKNNIKAFISAPIFYGEVPTGLLFLTYDEPLKKHSKDQASLLTKIAEQSATAIELSRVFEQLEKSKNRETLIRHITDAMRSSLDINEIKNNIITEVGKAYKADRCFIRLFGPNNTYLSPKTEYLANAEIQSIINTRLSDKIDKYNYFTLNQNRTISIEDMTARESDQPEIIEFKEALSNLNVKSYYGFPIFSNYKPIGAIILHFTKEKTIIDNDEKQTLKLIANAAGTAINHAELYAITRRESEKTKLIRRIMDAIGTHLEVEQVLHIACKEIKSILGVDRVAIARYLPDDGYTKQVLLTECTDYSDSISIKDSGDISQSAAYLGHQLLGEGQDIIINNIEETDLPDYYIDKHRRIGTKSVANVAIKKGENKWGVLGVFQNTHNRYWSEDEINLLKGISDYIYIALKQADLYSQTKKYADRAALIRRIISAIGTTLDLDDVMILISKELQGILGVDRVAIWKLPNYEDYTTWKNMHEAKSSPNIIGAKDIEYPDTLRKFLVERVLEENQELILEDIDNSDALEQAHLPEVFINTYKKMQTKSFIALPIKEQKEKWGLLVLTQVQRTRKWTEDEVELARTIAEQIYIAIRQAELYSTTKNYADRESILRKINNVLLSSSNLEIALDNITYEISNLFKVDRISISLYDKDLGLFTNTIGEFTRNSAVPSTKAKCLCNELINKYLYKELFDKKIFIKIDDIEHSDIPECLEEALKETGTKSSFFAPLIHKSTPLGMLVLSNTVTNKPINTDNLELLNLLLQQISIGINLFQTTEYLNKSLESEKLIKEILMNTQKQKSHDQVFDYLLKTLLEFFNADRAIHLHYEKSGSLVCCNEKTSDKINTSLTNILSLSTQSLLELKPETNEATIIINDVQKEISNSELKETLLKAQIHALIIYPLVKQYDYDLPRTSSCFICSASPRVWTYSEINTFKLSVDTTSLVYAEIRQRKAIEETKNTFIATLTHDLRGPVTAEQKAIEMLVSRRPETPISTYFEILHDMHKTNDELLRIINNILAVYHYESGNIELNKEYTNITETIESSVKSMLPLARDQGSDITLTVSENLPLVYADTGEINRVIINLINNAIKHNEKETAIKLEIKQKDNYIQISVADNGKGIPQSEKHNIFQRYPTTKRKIGTGLGLYLSKQIVDAHRGNIWFETKEGEGTTFFFTLPLE